MAYKVGIIGDKESVIGFAALGVSVFTADSGENINKLIYKSVDGGCAVIYITEELYQNAGGAIEEYKEKKIPAIIPIPSSKGGIGIGMAKLKNAVERAVGANAFNN
jgi:V/A-type H+-transporting ATPase subunit F